MKQKKSADDLLRALDNSKRAMPSEEFLTKMEALAVKHVRSHSVISKKLLFIVVACLLLLAVANAYVVKSINSFDHQDEIAQSYDLIPIKMLYSE